MTTLYRLILCAAIVVLAASRTLGQADPPVRGHVLVLTNERTVEGDIERVGDQYRVRHAIGETWVPGDKVLRLCSDMSDAYRTLRAQANLHDPDECLRLGRWCHDHGLSAEALENIAAAVKLAPDHAEARRLLAGLQRAAAAPPPALPAAPPVKAESVEVPELDTATRAAFAARVEPILMNACAGCHTNNRGGSFKLTRSYDTTSFNRVSLQQNLAAVLAQVNLQQPQESKLLVKAMTVHDPQARQAPLSNRQMAAYHTIEDWVQMTLANNPHLRERASPPAPTASAPAPAAPPPTPPTPAVVVQPPPARPSPPATGFAAAHPEPVVTTPVDEFDPILFNRQSSPPAEPKDDPGKRQ
jgi:hypothetical protein